MDAILAKVANLATVFPPLHSSLDDRVIESGSCGEEPGIEAEDNVLGPISGFVCVIEYDGSSGQSQRLITCRSIKSVGNEKCVGAICEAARSFRSFRIDRISAVYDAATGEHIGTGSFFDRFIVDESKEARTTWGLSRSRATTLVAGLNVLAFMARCDGLWHPLEHEPLEKFICSLWIRKEWEGDPPLSEIMTHATRLAPDAEVFFKSLKAYSRSSTSRSTLLNAVRNIIEADGVVCGSEAEWVIALNAQLDEDAEYKNSRYCEE